MLICYPYVSNCFQAFAPADNSIDAHWLSPLFRNIPFNLQDREKYKLGVPQSFHYLNQSNCYELDGVNDAHEYLETRRAMDIVGISEEEQVSLPNFPWKLLWLSTLFLTLNRSFQEAIFRVVAAILHLGNVEFAKGEEIDSSVIKDEKSRFHLNVTAELLM